MTPIIFSISTRGTMNRTVAHRIQGRLHAFARDFESGEPIQEKYTCRNVELRFKPQPYDADSLRQTRDSRERRSPIFDKGQRDCINRQTSPTKRRAEIPARLPVVIAVERSPERVGEIGGRDLEAIGLGQVRLAGWDELHRRGHRARGGQGR
jgi:hypothetical protein